MKPDQDQIDVLKEHLPYELDMLELAFILLPLETDVFRRNSLLETFWLHARNLLEFFKKSKPKHARTAWANHFTQHPVEYDLKDFGDKIPMMHQQITHLSYDRTREATKKLTFDLARDVKGAVDRAVQQFQNNLRPEAKAHWKERPVTQVEIPEVVPTPSCYAQMWAPTSSYSEQTFLLKPKAHSPPAFKKIKSD